MKNIPVLFALFVIASCQSGATSSSVKEPIQSAGNLDTATFAGGCFWCVEASFEQIKGVFSAVSGYSGGKKSDASYDLVSSGHTRHAEAVQVYFDPNMISYEVLLDIFFTAHDPTQINRQGPDVGYQYRSAIFYHNAEQKRLSAEKMEALKDSFEKPIATELTPLEAFYPAEDYHQDYEKHHPYNPYILNVSKPKIEKVARKFSHLLKEE